MDTDVRFTTPATRRTIVATGAKLAYAAPLVAASLRLDRMAAAAVSPPRGTCPPQCRSSVFCFNPREPLEADWVHLSAVRCHVLDVIRQGCFTCVHCTPGGRRTVVGLVPGAPCGLRPELQVEEAACVDPATGEVICAQAAGGFFEP